MLIIILFIFAILYKKNDEYPMNMYFRVTIATLFLSKNG